MNAMLSSLCLVALALLPSVMLGLRAAFPKRMPWWAVVLVMVGLGWALILCVAILNETPESGSAKVFALFFGWAYALVWCPPWLLGYGVIQWVRCRFAGRNA